MSLTETNGADAPSEAVSITPAIEGPTNARDAASAISAWRAKQAEQAAPIEQPAVERDAQGRFAPRAQESTAQAEDAAPLEEATGETQEADPAEVPPLELPRSWSKEKESIWSSLAREAQEYLLEQDKTTSAELRRTQNEAAEKSKALEAKEKAADEARTRYEQAAEQSLQILQAQQSAEFADIKSMADVQKLATDDPFRFAQWQARQMQIQSQAQEVQRLNQERQETERTKFETWSKEQDSQFEKQFPEFADKDKAGKLREGLNSYLNDIGVPSEVLPKLWNSDYLLRDARMQRVLYDASRFHAAQKAAKSAVQAPKPPVQRPGTPAPRGAQHQEAIQAAQARLTGAKGIAAVNSAADLIAAKRAAAARR